MESKELNPIRIVDNKIELSSGMMEIGKYYPVEYLGKKYLFCMSKKGIIDIYEVVD